MDSRKLKGIHTAMKAGIEAAEVLFEGYLKNDFSFSVLKQYEERLRKGWVFKDLKKSRNFTQALEMGIPLPGGPLLGAQILLGGLNPTGKLKTKRDFKKTKSVKSFYSCCRKERTKLIPDDLIVIDKLNDVYLSRTLHDEDQDPHITLGDKEKCKQCLASYDGPCTKFCPAQVYERDGDEVTVNFSNCVHCKTCDLKCPFDNISWRLPEAGGGPVYTNL
ncbi:MAG: 4Fe-4S dicluster domain-containing protein [Bacteroidota bacterium]